MFKTAILVVHLAMAFSQEINLPMETYKTDIQAHFIAPLWSTEKVPLPVSEMTDGDLNTCASTTPGKSWLLLLSSESKRIIPTKFTLKMKYEAGKRYMVEPKVYMTDKAISDPLPELKEPQFRRCHKTYSGITPNQHEVTLTCKGQAGTYALIEYGNAEGLNICDIRVVGKYDTNLALRKPAGMNAPTYGGLSAEKAVDGSGNIGDFRFGTCATGHNHVHPYLWVNLGDIYDIEMVKVVNRADYGPERLNGLALYIKDSQPSNDPAYFNSGKCNALYGQAEGGSYVFPCFGRGRYVVAYIQTPQATLLTICEIEVYSKLLINVALNAQANGFLAVKDGQYLTDGSTTGPDSELMFILKNTSTINIYFPENAFNRIESVKIYSTVDITLVKIGTGHLSNRACAENVQLRALPHVNTIQCASGIITSTVDAVFQNPGVTAGIKEIEIFGTEEDVPTNLLVGATTDRSRFVKRIENLNDGSTTGGNARLLFLVRNTTDIKFNLPAKYQIERVRIFTADDLPLVRVGSGSNTCVQNVQLQDVPHVNEFMCANNILSNKITFTFGKPPGSKSAADIKEIEVYGKKA